MAPKNENLPVDAEMKLSDGGSITYANEVIAIISGIAANEIDGIAGMVTSGGFGDIIGKNRNITRGVKVEVGTEEVSVDLYTIIEYGQPIQRVATQVQENVRKSIEAMTGLKVVRVDVHVQGVSFEKDKREAQSNLEAANVPSLPESSRKKSRQRKEDQAETKEDRSEKAEKADKSPKEEAPVQTPEAEEAVPQDKE
ncbi:MAG: Asp23/Gls24 family envelope stress response protein [Eubacteriales bacterium]